MNIFEFIGMILIIQGLTYTNINPILNSLTILLGTILCLYVGEMKEGKRR